VINRFFKRAAAALVSLLVLLGAPGLSSYQAAAQVVRVAPGAEAGSVRLNLAPVTLAPAQALLGTTHAFLAAAPSASVSASAPSAAAPAAALAAQAAAALPAASLAVAAEPALPAAAAASAVVSGAAAPSELPAAPPVSSLISVARALQTPSRGVARSAEAGLADGARFFDLAAAHDGPAGEPAAAPLESASASASLAPAGAPQPKKIPRSMWGLFWGHHIATVMGIEFHGISQPFLVMETLKKSKAVMGMVRNVHMGSMSIVNLLPVGLLIDKTDFRTLFIGTSLARAALMGAIPLLFLAGHLTFAVLIAIVAINPIFQSTMIVADGAARMSFLGTDEKLNKEASATLGKWDSLAGMIMPLVASFTVGALVTSFGLGGYAIAYAVYSGLLLAAVPIYWFMVRDTRDHSEMGMKGFLSFLKGTGSFLWAVLKGLLLSPLALGRFVGKLFRTKTATVAEGEKLGWKEKLARVFDGHDATTGFAYILRNKTLGALMTVGAVEAFLSDAMPMVVLPNFIKDGIGSGPHFAVPLIGGMLATAGGIFGLMLAAESVGRFLASWRMEGDKGDRLIEKLGHGRFYKMAALSSLLFWLMWLVPTVLAPHVFWIGFGTVMAVQFLMQIFHGPVGIVMAPVVRNEIPDDKLGRVESAFGMVDMFFSAGGALMAGFLLDWFKISTAMAIIAAAITLTGVIEWKVPGWIFPDGKRPAAKALPPSSQP
jgi:hypothetical protein